VHQASGGRQRNQAATLVSRLQRLPGEQRGADREADLSRHRTDAYAQAGRQRARDLPQRERRHGPNRRPITTQ
jgi:hypothetical protein